MIRVPLRRFKLLIKKRKKEKKKKEKERKEKRKEGKEKLVWLKKVLQFSKTEPATLVKILLISGGALVCEYSHSADKHIQALKRKHPTSKNTFSSLLLGNLNCKYFYWPGC